MTFFKLGSIFGAIILVTGSFNSYGQVYIGNENIPMDDIAPHLGAVTRIFQVYPGLQLSEVATLPITEPTPERLTDLPIPAPPGAGQGEVIVTVGGDGILYAATWDAVYKQEENGKFSSICKYPYQAITSGTWPASSNGYGKITSLAVDDQGRVFIGNGCNDMNNAGPHLGVVPRVFQVTSGGQLLEVAALPITEPMPSGPLEFPIPAPPGAGQGGVIVTVGGDGILYAATWDAVYKQGVNGTFSSICSYPYQSVAPGNLPASSNGYGKIASLTVDNQGRVFIGNKSSSMDNVGLHLGVVPRVFQVDSGGQLLEVATLPITEPTPERPTDLPIPAPPGAGQGGVIVTMSGDGILYAATWNAVYKQEQNGTFSLISSYPYQAVTSGTWPTSSNGYGRIASLSVAARHPIVFIPGIAGSVLQGGIPNRELWPTLIRTKNINDLALAGGPDNVQAVDLVMNVSIQGQNLQHVYDQFIGHFTQDPGVTYKLFDLGRDPSRLGSTYMIDFAASHPSETKPTFFPFPYDWRKSNATHTANLKQYIKRIKQLHNGAKVDIVTHSMGGLLMRRYFLDFPTDATADVRKVVSIACPYWGAPACVYRMFSGNFFADPDIGLSAVERTKNDIVKGFDAITSDSMKIALATLPGAHELLPPSPFFENGGLVALTEEGFDVDGDGSAFDTFGGMTYLRGVDNFVRLKNEPRIPLPSTNNASFHSSLQDDSSNDPSLGIFVPTLHLYGIQPAPNSTIISTNVRARTLLGQQISLTGTPVIEQSGYGPGDGTVPTLSATRTAAFRAAGAALTAITDSDRNRVNHNGLMSNEKVWDMISNYLDIQQIPPASVDSTTTSPAPAAGEPTSTLLKKVLILGAGFVKISDSQGNQNTKLSDAAALQIPGVAITYDETNKWVALEFDGNTNITIDNDSTADGVEVEYTEGTDSGVVTSLGRYRFFPGTHLWKFTTAANQSPILQIDSNDDSSFGTDEFVNPTHISTGTSVDTTPPTVALELAPVLGGIAVTLSGSDKTQVAPVIRYSLNNQSVQTYSSALAFQTDQSASLKVFAEDAMGNTSGLIETTINPKVDVSATPGTITLGWSIAEGYVLEESSTLTGPWTSSSATVSRNEGRESVSIQIIGIDRKFYRLRSQRIEK